MATHNHNFQELRHRLEEDTRINTGDDLHNGFGLRVNCAYGVLRQFETANPHLTPIIKTAVIWVNADNDICIRWRNHPAVHSDTFRIPPPHMEAGEWIYDDQLQRLVDRTKQWVLTFKEPIPQMGEMMRQCLSVLDKRLELIEKAYTL